MKWKFQQNTFLFFSAIGTAFVFCEFILRFVGYVPLNTNTFDSNNLVIFKPNQSFVIKDRCFENTVVSNSLGFHSKEFSFEKPTSTFRIVVLGDSFVEAAQVPLEKTFFARLENMLNETHNGKIHYEVIPLAKSGHGTLLNLLVAREYAFLFQPDLIIESFISNDLKEDLQDMVQLHATVNQNVFDVESLTVSPKNTNQKFVFLKHMVFERSRFFEQAWMNFLVLKNHHTKVSPSLEENGNNLDIEIQTQIFPSSTLAQDVWEKQRMALRTMNQFFQEKNVPFVLVHLTEGYALEKQFRADWKTDEATRSQFDTKIIPAQLEKISRDEKFSFFSTQEYFLDQYNKTGKLPVWSCDHHYNELGHLWAAEALYEYLTSSKIIDFAK